MRDLDAALAKQHAAGLYRQRRIIDGAHRTRVEIDGASWLSFCSNDYLGLAADPRIAEALREGTKRYGVGSGAAHLISGHNRAHQALEESLAAFTKRQRALLFSTGYMANLGVITALVGRGDTIVADRLNHASLVDGARLSGARLRRYAHADPVAAEALTSAHSPALIASDGVFSMDGDLAPLPELAALARQAGAWLLVDDAHGLGVLGKMGQGSLEHWGLNAGKVPILVGTLGKALGSFGAFVAGDVALIETLIQRARSYIYTTALPPAVAYATQTALHLAQKESWRRDHLNQMVQRFRAGAAQLGLPIGDQSSTPIVPLLAGDARTALAWSEQLARQRILVTAIRPPTVPENTSRLRITFSAAHQPHEIDQLLEVLAQGVTNHC